MNILLPLLVAVPLAAGFVLSLLPKKIKEKADFITIAVYLVLFVKSVSLYGYEGIYRIGGWEVPLGISLRMDSFSWLMIVVVSFLGLTVLLFSIPYMKRYTSRSRYYVILLMMTAGINGTLLAGDIFNRFVYVELAAIASYVLVGFGCGAKELASAFKYAVLGAAASAVTLLGIAFLYSLYGTMDMGLLGGGIALSQRVFIFDPIFIATALILAGFFFKSALVPLHIWQPDALDAAPEPAAAIISGALVVSTGVYALVRTAHTVFAATAGPGAVMTFAGAFSAAAGALLAHRCGEYKKKFAYYAISQVGFIVMGFGLGGHLISTGASNQTAVFLAVGGGVFHLVNYAIFTPLIFLNYGAGIYAKETKVSPPGNIYSTFGIMSMAGIPPFGGFISKLMLITACFAAGKYTGYLAGIISAAAAVLTVVSLAGQRKKIFKERNNSLSGSLPILIKAPLWVLSALCLVLSLVFLPMVRETLLEPAVTSAIPDVPQKSLEIVK